MRNKTKLAACSVILCISVVLMGCAQTTDETTNTAAGAAGTENDAVTEDAAETENGGTTGDAAETENDVMGDAAETEINGTEEDLTDADEPEVQIQILMDEDIVLDGLFAQFAEGNIKAWSYEDEEEKYISDYYEKYSRREINAVNIMTEDLNGDGENELLIDINYAYADGIILVFHCQDGDLFEWESIEYGMHSPTVTLYTDVNMIEITGTGWTRIFYAYNPQGGLQKIFDCASFGEDLEDGSFRRHYSVTAYQDGIVKDEYFMEEVFDENDNVVFESSEEEILLFNNVLNDFLNTLGEGIQISM